MTQEGHAFLIARRIKTKSTNRGETPGRVVPHQQPARGAVLAVLTATNRLVGPIYSRLIETLR